MKTKASVEQKKDGISRKATIEHTEEQSIEEELSSKEKKPASLEDGDISAINKKGQEDLPKDRKIIKKKAKKTDDGKENISMVS